MGGQSLAHTLLNIIIHQLSTVIITILSSTSWTTLWFVRTLRKMCKTTSTWMDGTASLTSTFSINDLWKRIKAKDLRSHKWVHGLKIYSLNLIRRRGTKFNWHKWYFQGSNLNNTSIRACHKHRTDSINSQAQWTLIRV